jgi:thymidylate synthase
VTTVYERPQERVLFSAIRDANPFLHLMESLWMLAGRDDVAFLNRFVSDFGARFGEADGRLHGAYGHRWRRSLGLDQLDEVVKKLKANSADRQAVVQMWDAALPGTRERFLGSAKFVPGGVDTAIDDTGSNDLRGDWKDRPCNTHVYLRIRDEHQTFIDETAAMSGILESDTRVSKVLDITVCCRSNDIIWGAYGANAVHFSVLQEYLAARIGVGVGRYYQVSNNFHAYEATIDQLRIRYGGGRIQHDPGLKGLLLNLEDQRYGSERLAPQPLVDDTESFDLEVQAVLDWYENGMRTALGLENPFLTETVMSALLTHTAFKEKDWGVCRARLQSIDAPDWRAAMTEWIERRRK